MNSFQMKLEKGHNAEKMVADILSKKGFEVQDVSEDKECFNKGDLLLRYNNKEYYVDVKTDYQIGLYGNLIFEVGLTRRTGYYDGWFTKGKYDYIAFDNSKDNIVYIINFHKAKKLVPNIYTKTTNKWNENEQAYIKAYLLNVEVAKENGLVVAEYKYEKNVA